MNRSSKLLLSLVVILFMLISTDALCQAKKWFPKTTKPGSAGGGVRGLTPPPQTDELMEESASRGAICCMTFENKTGYFVDVWFDGVYQGRVSPWQAGSNFCLGKDYKTFTAQTVGKTLEWTGEFSCGTEGEFVLK